MATGWARDGAVQDQIDASIADAVERARSHLPSRGRGRARTQPPAQRRKPDPLRGMRGRDSRSPAPGNCRGAPVRGLPAGAR